VIHYASDANLDFQDIFNEANQREYYSNKDVSILNLGLLFCHFVHRDAYLTNSYSTSELAGENQEVVTPIILVTKKAMMRPKTNTTMERPNQRSSLRRERSAE
jgi:hypothetical protein